MPECGLTGEGPAQAELSCRQRQPARTAMKQGLHPLPLMEGKAIISKGRNKKLSTRSGEAGGAETRVMREKALCGERGQDKQDNTSELGVTGDGFLD